jgi:hypothetical protein
VPTLFLSLSLSLFDPSISGWEPLRISCVLLKLVVFVLWRQNLFTDESFICGGHVDEVEEYLWDLIIHITPGHWRRVSRCRVPNLRVKKIKKKASTSLKLFVTMANI